MPFYHRSVTEHEREDPDFLGNYFSHHLMLPLAYRSEGPWREDVEILYRIPILHPCLPALYNIALKYRLWAWSWSCLGQQVESEIGMYYFQA